MADNNYRNVLTNRRASGPNQQTVQQDVEEPYVDAIAGADVSPQRYQRAMAPTMPEAKEQIQMPTDTDIFKDVAKEKIEGIYSPLITSAQEQAETTTKLVETQTQEQLTKLQQTLPQLTRSFESYMATSGFGEGMQQRQLGKLQTEILDIASDIYSEESKLKYGIQSDLSNTVAGYKQAIAQGEIELADTLYRQALSKAQMEVDLGYDYIPPELQFIYSEMQTAEKILEDDTATDQEKLQAQTRLDEYNNELDRLKIERGKGYQTYKQRQEELMEYQLEFAEYIADLQYEKDIFAIEDTYNATMYINAKPNATFEEVYSKFPDMDKDDILKYLQRRGETGLLPE